MSWRLSVCHADLDASRTVGEQFGLVLTECQLAAAQREVEVCFRGERRLVSRACWLDDVAEVEMAPWRELEGRFTGHADGCVLVTGGTRGLGLATAEMLVERGCRQIVLVGRREVTAEAGLKVQQWQSRGADVRVRLRTWVWTRR